MERADEPDACREASSCGHHFDHGFAIAGARWRDDMRHEPNSPWFVCQVADEFEPGSSPRHETDRDAGSDA